MANVTGRGRLAVATLLLFVVAATAHAAGDPWVEGDRLPFRLADLEGAMVDASDDRFAGKVVLVDLWATWCPPCLSEIPTLADLERRYRDRGLVVVAIAFEDGDAPDARRERLRAFVEEHDIPYLVLDGGRPDDFAEALPTVRGVRGLPVEILIDRDGRVVAARNGYGYKKRWAKKLDREIDDLLGNDGR